MCVLKNLVLAGVAQWIECLPVNRKVAGSIPRQGTGLGCGPGSKLGEYQKQSMSSKFVSHIDVSLPFFLPPFPTL